MSAFAGRIFRRLAAALLVLPAASPALAQQQPAAEKAAAVTQAVKANRALTAQPAPQGGWPADVAYAHTFNGLLGGEVPLSAFKGKAVLVVNTASKCGYTPQYEGLEALYKEFQDQGLVVVGVPSANFGGQEFGSEKEIAEFCELNFGVTFPMAAKYDVKGESRHAFYAWAEAQLGKKAVPNWNFHKILIGRDGKAVEAFATSVNPKSDALRAAVRKALG